MNNFESAYQAASAISSLADLPVDDSIALAVSAMCSVIRNEIEAVEFIQVKNNDSLAERLGHMDDLSFLLAAHGHAAANEYADHSDSAQFSKIASAMFRCASDMRNDLNGEERFAWNRAVRDHWNIAYHADASYDELRDAQAEEKS